MLKKYHLDFFKAKQYLEENLQGTNKLSNSVISLLNLESGCFFTFLAEKSAIKDVNEFTVGGKTSLIIDDISEYIFKLLKDGKNVSCIFDDFNADKNDLDDDLLCNSHGIYCDEEIYYLVDISSSLDLIKQALRRSNVIWHSLCVIGESNLDRNMKSINLDDIHEICLKARVVMVGAYDAESYVIWEKMDSYTQKI